MKIPKHITKEAWRGFKQMAKRAFSERLTTAEEKLAELNVELQAIRVARAADAAKHKKESDELALQRQKAENDEWIEQIRRWKEDRLQQAQQRQITALKIKTVKRVLEGLTDEELRAAVQADTIRLFDGLVSLPNSPRLIEPGEDDEAIVLTPVNRPKLGGAGEAAEPETEAGENEDEADQQPLRRRLRVQETD